MRAGLVGRPRAKSIRYQRPGLLNNGQWFGPLASGVGPACVLGRAEGQQPGKGDEGYHSKSKPQDGPSHPQPSPEGKAPTDLGHGGGPVNSDSHAVTPSCCAAASQMTYAERRSLLGRMLDPGIPRGPAFGIPSEPLAKSR